MWQFIVAGLVIGFVLNLTGWAGNVFLLGSMWEQARRGRIAADAFTLFATHSRNSSIRFRFRPRVRTVCSLLACERELAPIKNGPCVYLRRDRLAGRGADVLSRIG